MMKDTFALLLVAIAILAFIALDSEVGKLS